MKVLVVTAHPDDCEIGAGGFIALHDSIMLAVNNGANDSRSWRVAQDEMKASAEILGCNAEIWDYPMDIICSAQLVSRLDNLMEENEIDTLVTHFINDTNQAHVEVAKAAVAAGRRIPNILMMEPSPPAGRSWIPFRPQLYVDITAVAEKKKQALGEYKTQIDKYGDNWLTGLYGRELVRGWEAGVERAEAFEVVRMRI